MCACMYVWVGEYVCVWLCVHACECVWVGGWVCVVDRCMEKGRWVNVCAQYVGEYFRKVLQMLRVMNSRSGTLLKTAKSPYALY